MCLAFQPLAHMVGGRNLIDQAVIAHLPAHLPQRKLRPVTHWCLQARCLAWFLWVNDEGAGEVLQPVEDYPDQKSGLSGSKACDQQVEQVLKKFPTAPIPTSEKPEEIPALGGEDSPKKKKAQSCKRNDPVMDLAPELARICGMDLTQSAGLRVLSVLSLISEIGLDMSRWPNEKAFSCWLGLCPHNKISGGRILSRRTRKVVNRAATTLRLAALGVSHGDDWLGLFHHRMKSRLGPAGAITATAHKLASIIYHLLKTKEPYIALESSV